MIFPILPGSRLPGKHGPTTPYSQGLHGNPAPATHGLLILSHQSIPQQLPFNKPQQSPLVFFFFSFLNTSILLLLEVSFPLCGVDLDINHSRTEITTRPNKYSQPQDKWVKMRTSHCSSWCLCYIFASFVKVKLETESSWLHKVSTRVAR